MIVKRVVVAAVLALAACAPPDPAPPLPTTPGPSPSASMSVSPTPMPDVVAEYRAEAYMDETHSQQIVVRVGRPVTVAEYAAQDLSLLCPSLSPKNDRIVRIEVTVTNTSPANAAPIHTGAFITPTVDSNLSSSVSLGLEYSGSSDCNMVYPLGNAELKSVGGLVVGWNIVSIYETNLPAPFTYEARIILSPEPGQFPLEAFFLRLSPHSGLNQVDYRITSVESPNSIAGFITNGPDNGAVYVPLKPQVSPCTTIAKRTPMRCGSKLAVP